jgi:hypothetical protein
VAEFTDVDLDSVSLPSGYEISEDGGDLVVRDTSGTVALRRVDGGNWSFETNTVEAGQVGTASNPADVEAAQVNANQLGTASNPANVEGFDINAQNSLTLNGDPVGGSNNQGCRVFLSANQSISAGSRTKIQFDSEVYDSGGNFDTGTHNWTCPENGLYAVTVQIQYNGGGDNQTRQALIGTATDVFPSNTGAFNREISSDSGDRMAASTINKYASGDTIAAYARNSDASDSLGSGAENFATFMEVAFLGNL